MKNFICPKCNAKNRLYQKIEDATVYHKIITIHDDEIIFGETDVEGGYVSCFSCAECESEYSENEIKKIFI